MASPQGYSKFLDNNKVTTYAIDQDLTTPAVPTVFSTWVDMKGYGGCVMIATGINLTGVGVDALSIMADSDSDGGGGNVEIVAHAVGTAPSSEGDSLIIECQAEQLRQEGADNSEGLRYVAPKIGLGNAADECTVTIILTEPQHAYLNLTPDTIT